MSTEELLIKNIDRSTAQGFRVSQHPHVVQEYAIARRNGDTFPPVIVFRDGDKKLWLADGAHRLAAWELDKLKTIKSDVREGSRRDACLYAAGANAKHGMRRTLGDVGIIVTWFLRDSEFKKWTDNRIAKAVGCSGHHVGQLRRMLGDKAKIRFRQAMDADGQTYDIDTDTSKRNHDDRPKPVTASVRCPHCGRSFQLLRGAPS